MKPLPTLRTGGALRAGLRLIGTSGGPFALLFGARAVQGIVEASLGPALVAALEGTPRLASGLAGAGLITWLLAELAAACALALAGLGAARRLLDRDGGSGFARPALAYFFVGGAVLLASRLWTWTSLGATGWAYLHALLTGEWGAMSALGFALALMVGLPLGLLATLWTRQGLARALVTRQPFARALHETVDQLRRRPAPPLLVLVITGLLGGMLALVATMLTLPFSVAPTAVAAQQLSWASAVVGAALAALGTSLGQLWGFFSLCALEASSEGPLADEFQPVLTALPVPRPAPTVVVALPVEPGPPQ